MIPSERDLIKYGRKEGKRERNREVMTLCPLRDMSATKRTYRREMGDVNER